MKKQFALAAVLYLGFTLWPAQWVELTIEDRDPKVASAGFNFGPKRVLLTGGNASAAGGTVSNCSTVGAVAYYAAAGTTVSCPTGFTTSATGALAALSLNGNTFTTGTYTLTGGAGKTLTFNNTITLAGTDAQTYTFPTTSATIARTDAGQTFTGTNVFGITQATSLAVNGCAIGVDALCITGTVTFSGGLSAGSLGSTGSAVIGASSAYNWNGRAAITSPAVATVQYGNADAASPVAQTIKFQSVVAGNANTAAVNATITGSLSNGSGANGKIIFQLGKDGSSASGSQSLPFPMLSLNNGNATGATVQFGDGTNFTTYDSCTALTTGATGVVACTASAMRFKDIKGALAAADASRGLDKLTAGEWTYKPEFQDQFGGSAEHVSLYADDVAKMDARCVTYENGDVHDYWDRCVVAYLVADRKAMKAEIEALRRRMN